MSRATDQAALATARQRIIAKPRFRRRQLNDLNNQITAVSDASDAGSTDTLAPVLASISDAIDAEP